MKIKLSLLAVLITVLISSTAFGQIGRGGMRRPYNPPPPQKNSKPFDFAEEATKHLQKELKLDDFQAAAIKHILESEKENLLQLNKAQDITENERQDRGREITDRIDAKIIVLLSPEQAEKYKEMQEKKKKS